MITTKITMTGIEEALREADDRIEALRDGINSDLEWFGKTTSDVMVETHTFQNRTYRLETSIGYRIYPLLERFGQVQVFALADYASLVEEGHPGARPYPFFWPVFWNYEPMLWERLRATLTAALGGGERAVA